MKTAQDPIRKCSTISGLKYESYKTYGTGRQWESEGAGEGWRSLTEEKCSG